MAFWQVISKTGGVAIIAAMFSIALNVPSAAAQPPPSNPNHMCGTDQFTVPLPGSKLGIDANRSNSDWLIEVPSGQVDDQITLPDGCSIYAFLISGWSDNDDYDQIIFYKLAEYVAQNNGYFHVGWWNNLGKEYMERPLHQQVIKVTKRFLFIPILEDDVVTNPGSLQFPEAFLEPDVDLPKANPDEDFQFVDDLRRVLRAIRDRNPNALIVLAGHSMGGKAIVNAVAGTDIQVDLLAAIDPVGNRDMPFVPLIAPFITAEHNWSRWRATNDFKGWKVRDCIRNNEPDGTGLCRNYGTFFNPSYKCTTRGPWELVKPGALQGSLSPIHCPGPYEDPATLTVGRNIKRLYYRWQTEVAPPTDYDSFRVFTRPGSTMSSTDKFSPNLQAKWIGCTAGGYDPLDDRYECRDNDGHGEIIGVRSKSDLNDDETEVPNLLGKVRPGLQLQDWPARQSSTFTTAQRRQRLIELASDGSSWPYRPRNPDLCGVCQDLVDITASMLADSAPPPITAPDVAPPTSSAVTNVEANGNGWFNEDVVVSVSATDDRALGAIHLALSGAQSATTATPGNNAAATITAEGLTTVSYFAQDAAGNNEEPHSMPVRIDKTAPDVTAQTDVAPNAHGWFRTPVVVSFTAIDEAGGSGLGTVPPAAISVSTEGADQEIAGTADDNADNTGAGAVILNIDLTPPVITANTDLPPNAYGWNNTDVRVTFEASDALSGIDASSPDVVVSSDGADQLIEGTATDRAGHTSSTSKLVSIDKTAPSVSLQGHEPAANAAGWNRTDVTVTWTCGDALSGPIAGNVSQSASAEGAATTLSAQCADRAGNSASGSHAVSIDKTAPAIQIVSPSSSATYLVGTVVNADYSCTDALSGPGSCAGPAASGVAIDTSTVGARLFTVNAADVAGNTNAATHSYAVQYAFSGFQNPIAPTPAINSANAGRTVPIKYALHDANGALITDLASFVSLVSVPVACATNLPTADAEEIDGAGSTTIRFDADKFIFNWKTVSAWKGTCRMLQLKLADGTQHSASFLFK